MKIAELFAEISFKVNGADDLKKFDDQMKSVAASARDALVSLRALARVQLPKEVIPKPRQSRDSPQSSYSDKRALSIRRDVPGAFWDNADSGDGSNSKGRRSSEGASSTIRSANIIIQSARIVITGDAGGEGGGMRGVIPSAGGESGGMGIGSIAKFGFGLIGIATVIGAVRALALNFKEMIATQRQAAFATDKFTTSTGLTRRELKQWEHVGNAADLPNGTIESALLELNRKRAMAMTIPGSVNMTPYGILGMNIRSTSGEQLMKFFNATKDMAADKAESFASLLGIDPSVVYARKYLDQYDKTPASSELSDQQQAKVMALNSAWQDMTFNAGVLAAKINSDLAPTLREVVGIITKIEGVFSGDEKKRTLVTQLGGDDGVIKRVADLMYADAQRRGVTPQTIPSVHTEVNVTNHGTIPEVLLRTGKTVTRAVSDALFGVHPALADR